MKICHRAGEMAVLDAPEFENDEFQTCNDPLRLRSSKGAIPREKCEIRRKGWRCQQSGECGRRIVDCQSGALHSSLRRASPPRRRTQIDEPAAAERALRRDVPDDKAVWHSGGDRPVEHQLDFGRSARLDWFVVEQDDVRPDFGCGVMQAHREPLADRFFLAGQHAQDRIDAIRRRMQFGFEDDVTATDRILGDVRAR